MTTKKRLLFSYGILAVLLAVMVQVPAPLQPEQPKEMEPPASMSS